MLRLLFKCDVLFYYTGCVIPKMLLQLCSADMTPTEHLEHQQGLVKQFAKIMDFVLKFDELKVYSWKESLS